MFVVVFGILFLDLGAIAEHDAAQVTGGAGAEDVASEACPHQLWNVAAVVNVRMRKDKRLDLGGIAGKFPVHLLVKSVTSLKDAAVEQEFCAIGQFDQMH
jgi:hypothetical protein